MSPNDTLDLGGLLWIVAASLAAIIVAIVVLARRRAPPPLDGRPTLPSGDHDHRTA